ncbi:Alcohol dehydrogenase superfamily, zinc-type [Cordyceps fumosorosea ARSEF 2679]|uniref:Alcohol dehydrogenase superfamily, zinc-type n=1 Tax=Cordyceps fumosorosea (strain ARSEF 2679) TaxID=1081104 RepID=A0A162IAJ2_CORFA|nr:Alcohol dehydrogenase superfamily, zinc-type [Cordyceps fumosorosea ARSEF 2679]OAA54415.1 Alcohol dehydrogenase superfamily, zinc-type [Cordyceps fumosorosea ARSEF 2679]
MKAVVFDGPRKVSIQDRPVPRVRDDRDIIIKVQATALCGSELHVYRGHQPSGTGFIMGHEFTGVVVEAGSQVKTLKVGDKVVSPFTACCGECFYCQNEATSRCVHSKLFGSAVLDGGQAEYARIPMADSTAILAPKSISDKALVLMADIFPTGYYGVKSAVELRPKVDISQSTFVVIGCGPVGICAVICALHLNPKHVFAVDNVDSRLKMAKTLGAVPLNFKDGIDKMQEQVRNATGGRGADFVVEVVGLSPALKTAYDLVRPFGAMSSIGIHNAEIPWSGADGYAKNVRFQMGRCPVRSIFPEALALLEQKQKDVEFMFDNIMPLSDAVGGYDMFDKMKVHKIVFVP